MKKSELKKLIKKILKEDIDPRMTGYGMRDFRKSGETSDPFKLYNPSGEDVQSMKGLSKFLKNALEIIEDSNFDFKSMYYDRNKELLEKAVDILGIIEEELKERTEEMGTMSDEEADELIRMGDIYERKNK